LENIANGESAREFTLNTKKDINLFVCKVLDWCGTILDTVKTAESQVLRSWRDKICLPSSDSS